MIGSPKLSAVKEDKEHLIKNIDKCYKISVIIKPRQG
ncbi:hypothetical protein Goshw_019894 [Gossypium schwendimanii]|uniref:Uncharacterized protein n=1 Tax=Gossypium schwendimanii TaxID=34291 RepID=A0A7J9M5S3_GOSSC|nr:hypothetical protein [Gossypium schwendimanii]